MNKWNGKTRSLHGSSYVTLRTEGGMENVGINFVFPTIEKLSFMVAFVLLFSFFRLWEIRSARFHHNYEHKTKAKSGSCVLQASLPSSRSSEQSNRVKPRVIIEPIYRYPFPIDRVRSLLINHFSRRLTGELDLGRRFCLPQWVSCFRRFVK